MGKKETACYKKQDR